MFRSYAQNLVPNYSFEDTLQCPNAISQVTYSPPWFSPTNIIANYLNSCNNGFWGVPSNIEGVQLAHTGNAYAGIVTYYHGGNVRQYLEVGLVTQLIKDRKYCVEFFVSLADTQTVAANDIGMYFSDTSIYISTNQNLNLIPQINNNPVNNPLTDKIGWTKISGIFSAGGGEKYIIIGNFLDDALTDTTYFSSVESGSYYYIDDVSVKCCDCDTSQPASMSIPNIFTPNNDGINDVFKITTKNITRLNCKIYNRWGILVSEITKINEVWDGLNTSGLQCENGVYYYVVTARGEDGKEYNEKGFVQLVR